MRATTAADDPLRKYVDFIVEACPPLPLLDVESGDKARSRDLNTNSSSAATDAADDDEERSLWSRVFGRRGGDGGGEVTTYSRLTSLHKRVKRAGHQQASAACHYADLVAEAVRLSDIHEAVSNGGGGVDASIAWTDAPARTHRWAGLVSRVEFHWHAVVRRVLLQAVAVLLGLLSAVLVWSEITLCVKPVNLSPLSHALLATKCASASCVVGLLTHTHFLQPTVTACNCWCWCRCCICRRVPLRACSKCACLTTTRCKRTDNRTRTRCCFPPRSSIA